MMEAEAAMRAAVRRLMSFGTTTGTDQEIRSEAAREVGRLARSDERRKRLLAELGVVPPLVSMLDGGDGEGSAGARLAAAGALLELARGTHRNKVHIVQAGLLKKLPRLMDLRGSHDLALLLLSITSLASTDFRLPTAHLLPFLVATLAADDVDVPARTKLPCLAALRNLSAKLEHVRDVACSGAVRALLALALERETAEPALSVLVALVSASAAGRREVEEDETAPTALVEAMAARHEGTGAACSQEHATYLVMVLAHGHRGLALRRRMRQLGAVQALLEVSLLGSPLARKRAAKILQWFKDEGQDRIRAHSGPRMEGPSLCHANDDVGDGDRGAKACQNDVDRIVKQSLDKNMTSILRRATAASVDMTNVKLLVQSSSSKSLPC